MARRILYVAVFVLSLVGVGLSEGRVSRSVNVRESSGAPYGWPIKPFHREHPVRGLFGDPRTRFLGPPTTDTLLRGDGAFGFHFGVDIITRGNQPVYPVESGIVTQRDGTKITIASVGSSRSFEYWHLRFRVRPGQRVVKFKTVIGIATDDHGHVHLAELDHGRAVNPLQPGHLTPYRDNVAPRIAAISFRRSDAVTELLPVFVSGPVFFVAEAYDSASNNVPGPWHGLPVVPALVRWRIETWNGKTVVPNRVAVDFRRTEPPNSRFWETYARGTHQNMTVLGTHYSWAQPGVYRFMLMRRPFDTSQLRDGAYDVVVTAVDIRGNAAVAFQRFSIHNGAGWR